MNKLLSGAGVPATGTADIVAALNLVGAAHNVDPAAIAGIIHMESVWDTTCVTGQYIGLTQVGPELLTLMHLTKAQFLALSAAEQIAAYGQWLNYYHFMGQMGQHSIDVASQPLARQAAILQAMQFAPNGQPWKIACGQGDYSVPSTHSQQAVALGDTSIDAMETYYAGFFVQHPPVYAAAAGLVGAGV
jgi:hypothetical protein